MGNKLVIVESPAKAKTIGKYLGRGYKVEASNGHVRDLPKSQIGVDVENNFEPRYITIRGRGEILEKIRKEAKTATKIYLATDPDREGEAISWHLANVLKIDPNESCRVEFHEITSKAVKAAMKVARPINIDLVNAQQARRVLDRLVGYKISPLLWAKIKKGLSAGRVQSVATRMICDREREIEEFVADEYWNISAPFTIEGVKVDAKYKGYNGEDTEIKSAEQAELALSRIKSASGYTISNVKRGEKRKFPSAPFTTSNLQQEASRKLNFTTQKTMQIAQQLYEGIELAGEGTQGLISYIRTDSTRVSDEALEMVREAILNKYGKEYLPETANTYKSKSSAQDAHEAIRPTELVRRPETVKESLTRDQYKLYKLIFDRFVASQMTPAIYETMTAEINGDGCEFRFSGSKRKFPGFMVVYVEGQDDTDEEKDVQLPDIMEGMIAKLGEVISEQKFTQPPPRYTEASLVHALEEKGIGRPSTYSPTISTVLGRGYITREGKRLIPTELGLVVTDMMKQYFSNIVDITFTADMEEKLDKVEENGVDWHNIIADFYGDFAKTLEIAENTIEKIDVEDQVSDVVCDKCGAMMVYKMGRFGKFLACPKFPECRNTKAIFKEVDATCPSCGGKVIERLSKKGRKFYGCEHYPECAFVSWDMPVDDKCPECGSNMVLKRGKKGDTYHVCTNETCRHRVDVTPTTNDNNDLSDIDEG